MSRSSWPLFYLPPFGLLEHPARTDNFTARWFGWWKQSSGWWWCCWRRCSLHFIIICNARKTLQCTMLVRLSRTEFRFLIPTEYGLEWSHRIDGLYVCPNSTVVLSIRLLKLLNAVYAIKHVNFPGARKTTLSNNTKDSFASLVWSDPTVIFATKLSVELANNFLSYHYLSFPFRVNKGSKETSFQRGKACLKIIEYQYVGGIQLIFLISISVFPSILHAHLTC